MVRHDAHEAVGPTDEATEVVPVAVEGLGQVGDRRVELGRVHGDEDPLDRVERVHEAHGALRGVRPHDHPVAQRRSPVVPGLDELDVLGSEDGPGQHPGAHVGRDLPGLLVLDEEVGTLGPLAGVEALHLADDEAAVLHVRARAERVAEGHQLVR